MRDPTMSTSQEKRERERQSLKRKHSATRFKRIPLPIDEVEEQIIDILSSQPTCIIIGETGSGKSTQIPQLCLRGGIGSRGKIGITQPRRVAAISLATRVSEEMSAPLGEMVGYHVRFEKQYTDDTKICYMTDGILLRELMQDALLSEYSAILVDEAHERSLHTDVLLSVLRLCQRSRANTDHPLRIVIMSATMQADLFSSYFDNAPIYVIKGRTFPVDIHHAHSIDPSSSDYVYNAIVCVKDIHLREPLTEDVLVFLTGREEIEMAARKLRELNKELPNKLYPVPLFAAMTSVAQMKAFDPAPHGERKVVLATNIAETSLTIPGIRIVVDSGKIKTRTFTAKDRIDVLRVHSTSKAQAVQRTGRAGREAPGKCYRLYPRKYFDEMPETSVPEILRSNLSAVVLELLSMGLKKPRNLKLIEMPDEESIAAAERELIALGAVEKIEKKALHMTEQGNIMSKFPLNPDQAKVLLYASELRCLEEALSVVAVMSTDTIFDTDSRAKQEDIARARQRFATNEGDHLTYLNVFQIFRQEKKKKGNLKEWCSANFLNFKNLLTAIKIRKQLRDICQHHKLSLQSCGANRDKLRQALSCGMFMNVCEYDRQEDRYRLVAQPSTTIKIHPMSCMARSRPRSIVFSDLVRTTDLYAREVSLIDSEWVRPIIEQYKASTTKNGKGLSE